MINQTKNLFRIRSKFGTFTQTFLDGGYVAIGWLPNYIKEAISRKKFNLQKEVIIDFCNFAFQFFEGE